MAESELAASGGGAPGGGPVVPAPVVPAPRGVLGADPGVVAVCCCGVEGVEVLPAVEPDALSLGTGGAGRGGALLLPLRVFLFPGT